MENAVKRLTKYPALKIVAAYALTSAVYIYTSDFIVGMFTKDPVVLTTLQTYKGLGFIFITAALLFTLVKRNLSTTEAYYQNILSLRETADQMLRSSREEYMCLFNNSPVPSWLFDPVTLQISLVNDAACELYGYSREEFLARTIRDLRPPEDLPELDKALSKMHENEKNASSTLFRHCKKNGAILQVKIKAAFVNFDGKKLRLVSVTDVTGEMLIHARLMETHSRLKAASELAGLGYWINNMETHTIQWSEEMYKIFEVNPDTFQLDLNNIKNRFHPDHRADFENETYKSIEHQTIRETEHRIISGTGKTKWILERQFVTRDKNGNPVQIEGIVLDITSRRQQEQHIRDSNERFKMLTKATVEAIIDWDIENNVVIWGEGFQTMLGYDLNTYDFHLWSRNIHEDDRKRILQELKRAISDPDRKSFNAEFRFLKANGEITYVQHRGIFIRNAEGKAVRALGAMIDLSEALSHLRKIELQDQALKEIAWTQSHIVRAPLANLMGLISLLKNNVNTGVSDDVLLGYISKSAEELDKVIREIVGKTKIAIEEKGRVA